MWAENSREEPAAALTCFPAVLHVLQSCSTSTSADYLDQLCWVSQKEEIQSQLKTESGAERSVNSQGGAAVLIGLHERKYGFMVIFLHS